MELQELRTSMKDRRLNLKDSTRHAQDPTIATDEEFHKHGGSRINRLFENEKLQEKNLEHLTRKAREDPSEEKFTTLKVDGKRALYGMQVDPEMPANAEPKAVFKSKNAAQGGDQSFHQYKVGPMKATDNAQ